MIRLYAQSNIKYFFRFSNMSLNQFFTAINTTICNRDCKSHVSLYPCLSFRIYFFIYFLWNFAGICNSFKKCFSWDRNFKSYHVLSAMTCIGVNNLGKRQRKISFLIISWMQGKVFSAEKQVFVYSLKQKQKLALLHALLRPYVL